MAVFTLKLVPLKGCQSIHAGLPTWQVAQYTPWGQLWIFWVIWRDLTKPFWMWLLVEVLINEFVIFQNDGNIQVFIIPLLFMHWGCDKIVANLQTFSTLFSRLEIIFILIQNHLKFVAKGPSDNNNSVLVPIMVWCGQVTIHHLKQWWTSFLMHINGPVQKRCNSSALAMELRLSCISTLIYVSLHFD